MQILMEDRSGLGRSSQNRLRSRLRRVLEGLACGEDAELSVVLTTDPDIAELNRQYLGRSGPTNVIAFPMLEGEDAGLHPGLLGDVVVSVDTAGREAAEAGLEAEEHLVRLLIHGVLHLVGHDHERDADQARRMEELTERLLAESAGAGEKE